VTVENCTCVTWSYHMMWFSVEIRTEAEETVQQKELKYNIA